MIPIDAETAAWIGVGSSFVSAVVGYGIAREKVSRLEMDVREMKSQQDRLEDKFVTVALFDAVVVPLKQTLDSVQQDIKTLLKMVAKKGE